MDKLTFVTIDDGGAVALVPIRRVTKVFRGADGEDAVDLDDNRGYMCSDADKDYVSYCRFEDCIVDFKENDDE